MIKYWYVVAPKNAPYHVSQGYISDGVNGPSKFDSEDLKHYGVSEYKKVAAND
ncbi:hypothetical protein [Lactobacillus sp. ESL0677]|uniref:hypothetical protein n=1 Tax=Lactobacillus sp. ESL0677 TaxID=2983208 RepID=UPI0023F93604|nr:hypothetical protein [Lactobacillus sp. ESL0677]WEV36233.1 hypothetical protein OZX76_05660 [Lactobacillus sp. ESL0677]